MLQLKKISETMEKKDNLCYNDKAKQKKEKNQWDFLIN